MALTALEWICMKKNKRSSANSRKNVSTNKTNEKFEFPFPFVGCFFIFVVLSLAIIFVTEWYFLFD
jgi:hypothetical protein